MWTASTDNVGVAGYRVYRDGALIGTSTTAGYADTTAQPSTAYGYHVVAYDAAGNSSVPSNTANITTPADAAPPSAPTNLAAAVVSATRVDLTWTASTDNVAVTGYRIYRNGSQIGTSTGTSYSDTSTQASSTYDYQVRAVDGANNVSAASNIATATTPSASVLTFLPTADAMIQQAAPTDRGQDHDLGGQRPGQALTAQVHGHGCGRQDGAEREAAAQLHEPEQRRRCLRASHELQLERGDRDLEHGACGGHDDHDARRSGSRQLVRGRPDELHHGRRDVHDPGLVDVARRGLLVEGRNEPAAARRRALTRTDGREPDYSRVTGLSFGRPPTGTSRFAARSRSTCVARARVRYASAASSKIGTTISHASTASTTNQRMRTSGVWRLRRTSGRADARRVEDPAAVRGLS